ncbi:Hypothetical protein CINCED_3A001689 [Cinara cedri]|uniref:Uncharacterized protein n=1 Tax=Cinara cedri TaxID=506608 RepID=A0A5E4NQM6_9HEMI|nr:Hypothetical protein CINCED_3A001689 [Cinara cedri]
MEPLNPNDDSPIEKNPCGQYPVSPTTSIKHFGGSTLSIVSNTLLYYFVFYKLSYKYSYNVKNPIITQCHLLEDGTRIKAADSSTLLYITDRTSFAELPILRIGYRFEKTYSLSTVSKDGCDVTDRDVIGTGLVVGKSLFTVSTLIQPRYMSNFEGSQLVYVTCE